MAVAALASGVVGSTLAGTLFTDGFESGTLSTTPQNGVSWMYRQSTSVSSELAATGNFSLKFDFVAVPLGEDSFAEQRIALPPRNAYWFKYKLYIPSNYVHRRDGASNNKFLALYQTPYLKVNPGFQVNFSLQPNSSGGSGIEVHHYNGGIEGPVRTTAPDFITNADKGKWMDLIAEVRVPTSATSKDGVMRLWKNNQLVVNMTDVPSWGGTGKNYIDQAYFLGWSNSGFTAATALFIDDVIIADTPLTGASPNPPTNLTVQ